MPGVLADLSVAGKLLLRTITGGHRQKIPSPSDIGAFRSQLETAMDLLETGVVAEHKWLSMAASDIPWIDSSLSVSPGEEVSWFVCGRGTVAKWLDIWVDPRIQVWGRVGDDDIIPATRLSHTVTASTPGSVKFGNYFPNDWSDRKGGLLQDESVYAGMSGEFEILLVRWAVPAAEGLAALAQAGDFEGLVAGEIERLAKGDVNPEGWHHLWNLGESEIYSQGTTERESPCIHCRTRADAGILQKPVSAPLLDSSEIHWRWRVDQLPSTLREDTLPSHDYLSIAVEFDNGKDITYYWSHNLPPETGYECPLPNWKGKEYHVVVRSGAQQLGQWLNEQRNLMADYRRYIDDDVPARIVAVWLISNSVFQRIPGGCTYSDIVVTDGNDTIQVL